MFNSLSSWLKKNPIPAFFGLTFLLAWSVWLPLGLLAPDRVLLTLLGAWAPSLSAIILISLTDGWNAVKDFLKRVLRWRVGIQWYLIVMFSVAFIACLAIGMGMLFGIPVPELTLPTGVPRDGLLLALPIIFLLNVFIGGPLAEDIGWRGYILPKMRERMSALNASLIIGIVWAIWHLPYFIFPGWSSMVGNIPFIWFMLLTTSWSVLFAWVYVNTESILMPVLFHAAINTTLGTVGILGHDHINKALLVLHTLLTWAMVGIVIALCGKDLIRKERVEDKHKDVSLGRI